jgi:hypothetical protein
LSCFGQRERHHAADSRRKVRQKLRQGAFAALAALVWVLPLPLAYLIGVAVLGHWDRCNIGINASANSLTMLFFVLPLLLLGLYLAGGLAHATAARVLGHRRAWAPLAAAAAMGGTAALAGWLLAVGPTWSGYPTYCIS